MNGFTPKLVDNLEIEETQVSESREDNEESDPVTPIHRDSIVYGIIDAGDEVGIVQSGKDNVENAADH